MSVGVVIALAIAVVYTVAKKGMQSDVAIIWCAVGVVIADTAIGRALHGLIQGIAGIFA